MRIELYKYCVIPSN